MRAYNHAHDLESEQGIRLDDYSFNDEEGTFTARLDGKRWGKKANLLAYFTLENGKKVVASAWWEKEYLGIDEYKEGTMLTLTCTKSKNGKVYLRKVEPSASTAET